MIIAGCIIAYLLVGIWTFGYVAAIDSEKAKSEGHRPERELDYYYDEARPWFGSIFWPIYLLFGLVLKHFVFWGWAYGLKFGGRKRIRVEIEKRLRVEQEKAEQELDEELKGRRGKVA